MEDDLVGRTVSHYRVLGKLGAGGMGAVYRAEDTRLRRQIALKFLPESSTRDAEARARFEREAQAASALDHPSICTIHDIDETADGQVFIAMTLYEGETLKQRLASGPLEIGESLRIAGRVAAGLAAAHARGIVHRDIKPANVMLTPSGDVKILDFGIAKLAGRTDLTQTGASPGTATCMAPEQIEGGTVDGRADVWALGVLLYEMVTGRNPFERDQPAAAMAAILTVEPEQLTVVRPDVPPELARLVAAALRRNVTERLGSAREFEQRIEALRRGTQESAPHARRRSTLAVASTAVALIATVLVIGLVMNERARTARERARELLPGIEQLAAEHRFVEARELALQAAAAIPDDTTLARLMPEVSDLLTVLSEPSGAAVRLVRLTSGMAPETAAIGTTPIRRLRIARSDHIVLVELDGYAPVERLASSTLMRAQPRSFGNRTDIELDVRLTPIAETPAEMVLVTGGRYELVSHAAPRGVSADLADFWIDRFEVSNRQYLDFIRAGGYANPDLWPRTFRSAGRTIPHSEAMALLVDRTGLPGPRSWVGQQYPEGRHDHPVTDISWYEAAAFAAWAGKSLPTLLQWEKAARNGLTAYREATIMPWGISGPVEPVDRRANFNGSGTTATDAFPFGMSPFGAYAMAGNVREWTRTAAAGGHIATGGSWQDPPYLFNAIGEYDDLFAASDLGFRCVRLASAAADGEGTAAIDLVRSTPVYEPVDEAAFRSLLSHYRYDRRDLAPEIVERAETPDWVREKILFDGPGGERVPAYLYLPRAATPPYQTLVYVPGSTVFFYQTVADETEWAIGPVIKAGRAVLAVVLEGMLERRNEPGYSPPPPSSVAFRDLMVRHAVEMRSGIDYLETRSDIDSGRLAYIGLSFGAGSRLVLAGTDDRFKAIIFIGGGIDERVHPTLPEASNINFAPYIRPPKLLLNGATDDEHPWLTRGLPLWNLLREPKTLALIEGAGHVPPAEERIPRIIDFLDRTLGPVR